jgi:hypothetical protein
MTVSGIESVASSRQRHLRRVLVYHQLQEVLGAHPGAHGKLATPEHSQATRPADAAVQVSLREGGSTYIRTCGGASGRQRA